MSDVSDSSDLSDIYDISDISAISALSDCNFSNHQFFTDHRFKSLLTALINVHRRIIDTPNWQVDQKDQSY